MSGALVAQAKGFYERVRLGVSQTRDLSHVAQWLCDNTTDPLEPTRVWTFDDHEFQVDILNDSAAEVDIMKCSQVGLSEVSVRLALAMLAMMQGYTAIYTLPSSKFAGKFAKTRIDPVIQNSKTLASMRSKEVDGAELKALGRSFLYINGTFGQSAAISVPAQILVQDEVDFSNQTVLTTYNSRLGHNKDGGLRRRFSTPTVHGFGISAGYANSSQGRYAVRHERCGKWVIPGFMADTVIPGFDGTLHEFDKEDLDNPRFRVSEAYLACPSCGREISVANLANPERRRWVHAFPERDRRGYHVVPFDVPKYNPVPTTLGYLADYERKADWVNFKVGSPYEDAETSFLEAKIREAERERPVLPEVGAAGTVLGLDVGKTSWLYVGRPEGKRLRTLYVERIKQTGGNYLLERTCQLLDAFGVVRAVIDAGPDLSVPLQLIERRPTGQVWACRYKRTTPGALTNLSFKVDEQVVEAARTGTLDSAAKRVNTGLVTLLGGGHSEQETFRTHLGALKRVSRESPTTGDLVHTWQKTGPDHFAHALNYALIAMDMLEEGLGSVPVAPMLTTCKLAEPTHREQRLR